MQQSLSNENIMNPCKVMYSNPYKSNYQQYPTLPKQQYNKQPIQSYTKQSSFNQGKQYFSNNYQPIQSNNYMIHNNPSHQPISMNQYSQLISPHTISNQNNNDLSQEKHSPQNLTKKIKHIKTALKIAQEHNQQLHTKLTNQKKTSQQQIAFYEKDLYRYKSLYEMLVDNFDKKAVEMNEMRRELQLKRVEVSELRRVIEGDCALKTCNKINSAQQFNSQFMNIKQLPTRQQLTLQQLAHENKVLRQQLLLKTKKLSEYDMIISTYQAQHVLFYHMNIQKLHKSHTKTLSQLQAKIRQLQMDNEKLLSQRVLNRRRVQQLERELQLTGTKLMSLQNELSRNINDNQQLKLTNSQLQSELQSTQQLVNDYESGQQKGKWKHMFDQLSHKYNQLLTNNYQTQKEFEKQLHLINTQVQRRQILKYTHR